MIFNIVKIAHKLKLQSIQEDNIKQSNDADYYLNDIKVNEDNYKNSSKKWSNTRDFFYIFSFFAVITIIGWILLNMVKYKKRCR